MPDIVVTVEIPDADYRRDFTVDDEAPLADLLTRIAEEENIPLRTKSGRPLAWTAEGPDLREGHETDWTDLTRTQPLSRISRKLQERYGDVKPLFAVRFKIPGAAETIQEAREKAKVAEIEARMAQRQAERDAEVEAEFGDAEDMRSDVADQEDVRTMPMQAAPGKPAARLEAQAAIAPPEPKAADVASRIRRGGARPEPTADPDDAATDRVAAVRNTGEADAIGVTAKSAAKRDGGARRSPDAKPSRDNTGKADGGKGKTDGGRERPDGGKARSGKGKPDGGKARSGSGKKTGLAALPKWAWGAIGGGGILLVGMLAFLSGDEPPPPPMVEATTTPPPPEIKVKVPEPTPPPPPPAEATPPPMEQFWSRSSVDNATAGSASAQLTSYAHTNIRVAWIAQPAEGGKAHALSLKGRFKLTLSDAGSSLEAGGTRSLPAVPAGQDTRVDVRFDGDSLTVRIGGRSAGPFAVPAGSAFPAWRFDVDSGVTLKGVVAWAQTEAPP